MKTLRSVVCFLSLVTTFHSLTRAETIWVEGEKPTKSTMNRHPWWYDQVKKDQLSGGDWISNFADKKPAGEAEYSVTVEGGKFEFWVRANPTATKLSFQLNDTDWKPIEFEKNARDAANIAGDGKLDLRFIAWVKVGSVELKRGANVIRFRMHSDNSNHGGLDCFVFSAEPFTPRGILKPGEIAKSVEGNKSDKDWFAFDPSSDKFESSSAIDLRFLNEKSAGEHGYIAAKDGHFVHSQTGEPVRFWAVNGAAAKSRDELKREARQLAKYGVNLVRLHGPMFDKRGEVDPAKIQRAFDVVEAMKAEGIYTHFSIYFPLWLDPPTDLDWLPGYDGKTHAFASLYFNAKFQDKYRSWWRALLTTPNPATGKRLIDEPAVFGAELINEDSFFFWTFNEKNIPDPQLRMLEQQFGDWLKTKYGSLDKAFAAWKDQKVARDVPTAGRIGFRPLWNIAHERTPRDQDTAQFLTELQRRFYDESSQFLRGLGFKGLITASNWATASPEVFGPLEKFTYTAGDFIDRHGYFGCRNEGEFSEWSMRDGHTWTDRSALRFESEESGKPASFVHPAMDPKYDNKPSMISETTWNRPNRHRGEAPLYLAAFGALQDSDCIVHFAKDGVDWSVKPGYFMQPWTLTAPTQLGQFPAAALIYRRGLVKTGDVMADVTLDVEDLLKLNGTPLPQDAAFDELRLKDVPVGTTLKAGQRIDPLIHFVGRTSVAFDQSRTGTPARRSESSSDAKNEGKEGKSARPTVKLKSLASFVDHAKKLVTSQTGELKLDWGKGILTINAPAAQGASGDLKSAGEITLADVTLSIPRDVAHVIVVSLDGRPLAQSKRMLLQVMTEERPTGFRSESLGERRHRITSIGENPWQVRKLDGVVRLRRSDAQNFKVTALDQFGQPTSNTSSADAILLQADTLYYTIESP
ncbi:MAG: hypothetical protein NT013_07095 [Planctomycetia bacterium]|nr:hypothetical protein [Planctomycetia bacterium]